MADSISFCCGLPCKKITGVVERILLYPDCLQSKEIYMLSATFPYESFDRFGLAQQQLTLVRCKIETVARLQL